MAIGASGIQGISPEVPFVQGGGGSSGRPVLTGNTTYYISTTGNNVNDGLTPATAWANLSHAYTFLTTIDFGGFSVTVQILDGTYNWGNADTVNTQTGWIGGPLTIQGNSGDRTKVKIVLTSVFSGSLLSMFNFTPPAPLVVQFMQVTGTVHAACFFWQALGSLQFGNMDFGCQPLFCQQVGASAEWFGTTTMLSTTDANLGLNQLFTASKGALAICSADIDFNNLAFNFNAMILCQSQSWMDFSPNSVTNTGSFNAASRKFVITELSYIQSNYTVAQIPGFRYFTDPNSFFNGQSYQRSNPDLSNQAFYDITGGGTTAYQDFWAPCIYANRPPAPQMGRQCTITDSTVNAPGAVIAGGGGLNVQAIFNALGQWIVLAAL